MEWNGMEWSMDGMIMDWITGTIRVLEMRESVKILSKRSRRFRRGRSLILHMLLQFRPEGGRSLAVARHRSAEGRTGRPLSAMVFQSGIGIASVSPSLINLDGAGRHVFWSDGGDTVVILGKRGHRAGRSGPVTNQISTTLGNKTLARTTWTDFDSPQKRGWRRCMHPR